MRKILTLLILFSGSAAFGQTQPPNQVFNGVLYQYKNSLRIDSNLFVPKRDTLPFNAALSAPGNMRWRPADSLLYYFNGSKWEKLITTNQMSLLRGYKITTSVTSLSSFGAPDSLVFVSDTLRGGYFIWSNTGVVDGGTVFAGSTGFWKRQYNVMDGLFVTWFGAVGDGVTDDRAAIQATVNASKPGGTVYFRSRSISPSNVKYIITGPITVSVPGLRFEGNSTMKGYGTTIEGTGTGYSMFVLNHAEISFENITIRGNGNYVIIDPGSGAGRWGNGATINGIKVEGDAGANGDLKLRNSALVYLDTGVVFKARNAEITNNIISQTKSPFVILNSNVGQQRGFKILDNWVHSPGDTNVSRAVVKCVATGAFQIWVNDNQIDGQPNSMLADITADSAVQIIGNNVTLGRGGLIRLTGVNGAQVNSNYFLGGSYLTRGDGIFLSGCTNYTISSNVLKNVAENGINLSGTNTGGVITGNQISNFSWLGKAAGGNFSGLKIAATGINNTISSNQLRLTQSYTAGVFIDFDRTNKNHLAANDYLSPASSFGGDNVMQFHQAVKSQAVQFGEFDSLRVFDFTYLPDSASLYFNKTGYFNILRFHDNGRILLNPNPSILTKIANAIFHSVGSFQIDLGSDAAGDLFYRGSNGNMNRLALGTASQLLRVNGSGNTPEWFTPTFALTSQAILNQTVSEEAKSFWVVAGNSRSYLLRGTSNPAIQWDNGVNSIVTAQVGTGGRLDFANNNSATSFTGVANIGIGVTAPTSKLHTTSFATAIATITGNTTTTAAQHTLLVNNSGTVTVTLISAVGLSGHIYKIKKISAAANDVIIEGAGSETIDGSLNKTLTLQWSEISLQSNGTNWFVIGSHAAATTL